MVKINQILVEIETAKAAVELPSPYAGKVVALLVAPRGRRSTSAPPIIAIDGPRGSAGTGGCAGRRARSRSRGCPGGRPAAEEAGEPAAARCWSATARAPAP